MQVFWGGATAIFFAAVALCAAVATPPGAWAQATPTDIRVSDVEVSDGGRVTAFLAVPELRANEASSMDAFVVSEAGERRPLTPVPVDASDVELTLVVDSSAEQPPQRWHEVESIAMELALRLPPDSGMRLIAMGEPAAGAQPATTDVLERVAAVGQIEPSGRRTLYDALALALDGHRGSQTRRKVVVIGAGDDQGSKATRQDVLGRLEEVNAALYVVRPAAGPSEADGLDDLAAATGGLSVAVEEYGDPLQAAAAVLDDVLHQYRLTFEADDLADTTLNIRVPADAASADTTVHLPLTTALPSTNRPTGEEIGEGITGVTPGGPPEAAWRPTTVLAALVVATLAFAGMVMLVPRTVGGWRDNVASLSSTVPAAVGATARAGAARVARSVGSLETRARAMGATLAGASAAAARQAAVTSRRGGVVLAHQAAAVSRTAPSRLASTGRSVRQVLDPTLHRVTTSQRPSAPAWDDVAAQVHREVGGDFVALHEAAQRIQSARHRTAAYERAAGLDARLAAVTLTPLPVVVAAIRHAFDPQYVKWLTAARLGWLSLAAAGTLTVLAALWLWRVAKPPFAASPARWRSHAKNEQRWRQTTAALDRAYLYAVAGLDLPAALRCALPGEPQPARRLLEDLLPAGREPDAAPPPLPSRDRGRLAVLLSEGSGGEPVDVLAEVRARVHVHRAYATDAQARKLPLATFVPFAVCLLPATLTVGLVGWS